MIKRLSDGKRKLGPTEDKALRRIKMTYTVDEKLFAKIKLLNIWPSAIIRRELKREVRRREALRRKKARRQIVNRFSGEVLAT